MLCSTNENLVGVDNCEPWNICGCRILNDRCNLSCSQVTIFTERKCCRVLNPAVVDCFVTRKRLVVFGALDPACGAVDVFDSTSRLVLVRFDRNITLLLNFSSPECRSNRRTSPLVNVDCDSRCKLAPVLPLVFGFADFVIQIASRRDIPPNVTDFSRIPKTFVGVDALRKRTIRVDRWIVFQNVGNFLLCGTRNETLKRIIQLKHLQSLGRVHVVDHCGLNHRAVDLRSLLANFLPDVTIHRVNTFKYTPSTFGFR
ncbi:hypothetical protein D3C86_1300230 [compost metagenome]